MRRPFIRFPAIALVALPCALFLAFFHVATLDVANPGWLIRGSDNGENALGLHAYLHDPTAATSLHTGLLNAPEGVPILFTDSNPLVGLITRPLAALLPVDAQFVGPWILLCLILSTVFAWLLLRRHAPGQVALWAGVALLAFPPTLFNRYIHTNLMAHWTILAALVLYLDPERRDRVRWWLPLIAITALIHSYLLVMVGAIWASALLARFVAGPGRARAATLAHGVAGVVLVGLLAWWLGVGHQQVAGNYGAFSMPLDALWNPGLQAYARLLPAHEQSAGRGFEGFQYLGAGGLALIVAALVARWRLPEPDRERTTALRLRWLVPALVVLTILAIARLPLSDGMRAALDPVRASGRLFWPVGYVLILMAVLAAFRLGRERAGLFLVGIVAVQVVDLSGMAAAVRGQNREAARHRLYVRTTDPRWAGLIAGARSVAFMPGDVTRDLDLFQEVAWRAVSAGRPVTNVYAARTTALTDARLVREQAAFARGELVPGRLYVLLPAAPLPPAATARMLSLDGVVVIRP